MTGLSRKRVFDEYMSLQHAKKRREDITRTEFTMCMICQGRTNKGLFNVQITTTPKLMVAMTAKQNENFRRLRNDPTVGVHVPYLVIWWQ